MPTSATPPTTWKLAVPEDAVHDTLATLPEDIAEPLEWLYRHYCEQRVSLNELGKRISLDGGNISRIWRGTYQGNLHAVAQRVSHYRTEFHINHGVGQPDFIRTRYAGLIFNAADRVANVGEIGRIIGDYGDGKTVALREYAALRPREVLYHECGESSSIIVNLREIGASIGVRPSANAYHLRERIFHALRRSHYRLLIIDDLHAIFNWVRSERDPGPGQFCDVLRKIHDRLGIAVLLCGTRVLPDKLERGIFREALTQLSDRGDTKLNLVDWHHPLDDLASFYAYYGLPETPTKQAQKIIDDVLEAHSLRKLVFKLRAGARGANSKGVPYTWEHFVAAQNLSAALASNPQAPINV